MFQKAFLFALTALVLMMAPFAYAGKVELTTYYPAPYGEYSELNASKSFIPPRMTTDERDAINTTSNPPLAQGMVIFNTSENRLEIYTGTEWQSAGGGPAWESPWTYVNGTMQSLKFTHNLGYFPTNVQVFTALSDNPTWIRPVPLQSQGPDEHWTAPESTWISKNEIWLGFWIDPTGGGNDDKLLWCDGSVQNPCVGGQTAWVSYTTGYIKVIIWK